MAKWDVYDDEPYPGPYIDVLDMPASMEIDWVEYHLKLWTQKELQLVPYHKFIKMGPFVRVTQRDPYKEYVVEDTLNLLGNELEIQNNHTGYIVVQIQKPAHVPTLGAGDTISFTHKYDLT